MTTGPDSPSPDDQRPQQPQQPPPPPYGQPPGGYPAPPPGYGQPPMRPEDEKMWAIGAHLGPFLIGFIAPLIVWLVFKDRSAFLDRHGKESLNFQLTVLIAYVVSALLFCVVIGIFTFIATWIAALVFQIIAAVKAGSFEDYRYPLTIRFIT